MVSIEVVRFVRHGTAGGRGGGGGIAGLMAEEGGGDGWAQAQRVGGRELVEVVGELNRRYVTTDTYKYQHLNNMHRSAEAWVIHQTGPLTRPGAFV